MKRVSFIRQSKLADLRGRINYISSPERQENLYATYSTASDEYWRDLARENREDFKCSGTAGKCIEARELIIALPPVFSRYDPEEMLKDFADRFKDKYGVECIRTCTSIAVAMPHRDGSRKTEKTARRPFFLTF